MSDTSDFVSWKKAELGVQFVLCRIKEAGFEILKITPRQQLNESAIELMILSKIPQEIERVKGYKDGF